MLLQIKVKLSNCCSKAQINNLAGEILANPKILSDYYKLSNLPDYEDADKASWIIRTYFQKTREVSLTDQRKIISLLNSTKNESVLRNILGIIVDFPFSQNIEEELVNTCFKILNERHHKVAVYANALQGLIPIVKKHPELREEIILIAESNPMKDKCVFQLRLKTILSLKSE
jgi:hypothetical protein